ncbi:MAG: 50S ribosomal protein L24 [Saprospiraceae bacterium]|jgi:large subunit ribosomal protein L24
MANKKFHIKKGDTVEVIAGADKGNRGEVLEMLPKKNRAIVADVNMVTKHKKPTENDPGGRIEQESSIHISNLMLVDPKTGEPTRIGRRMEGEKLVRYSKKSGETID